MLIYIYLGELKWREINIKTNFEKSNGLIMKAKMVVDKLYKLPEVLVKYFDYVRKLEYEEMPNYFYLVELFKDNIPSS
jgi:hypothetical protein